MIEGDPNVVEWQTWLDGGEPRVPDGMKPGGPWYPFAGSDSTVYWRRPLVRAEPERDVLAEVAEELERLARVKGGEVGRAEVYVRGVLLDAAAMVRAKR